MGGEGGVETCTEWAEMVKIKEEVGVMCGSRSVRWEKVKT